MHSKNSKSIEKLNQLRDRAAHLSGVAFTKVRGVAQTKLTGRSKVVGLAAAGVMTAGLVTGIVAAIVSAPICWATRLLAMRAFRDDGFSGGSRGQFPAHRARR